MRCPQCGYGSPQKPLTRRQREMLDFLAQSASAHGYMPSYQEMADHFGYTSLATVHEHLSNLRRKGWLDWSPMEARSIVLATP